MQRHIGVERRDSASDQDFEMFVRLHSASLLGTAFLLTGNLHSAEDLLQTTLTALFAKWDRVLAADAPVAYVRRSMTNRFVSHRRTKTSNEITLWDTPDSSDGEDIADRVADWHDLWQLLATLPDRQRSALVLRYFHDLPEREIAAAINCRPSTVRSLISRATNTLSRQTSERLSSDRSEGGR